MGVVYAAHQSSIARTVAVKMLKPSAKVGEEQRDKFISEAVVTGELDHPNIVPIYDLGANDAGALFYSMKRVKGTPWDKVHPPESARRKPEHPAARGRRGRVRPCRRRDAPRSEARKRDARRLRRSARDGLGPGADHARRSPTPTPIFQADSLGGTPAYMAPGNGQRPGREHQQHQRHLPARRDPLRDHRRPAAPLGPRRDAVPDGRRRRTDRRASATTASSRRSPSRRWPRSRKIATRRSRISRKRFASTSRTPKASCSRPMRTRTCRRPARRATTSSSPGRCTASRNRSPVGREPPRPRAARPKRSATTPSARSTRATSTWRVAAGRAQSRSRPNCSPRSTSARAERDAPPAPAAPGEAGGRGAAGGGRHDHHDRVVLREPAAQPGGRGREGSRRAARRGRSRQGARSRAAQGSRASKRQPP